MIENRFCVYGHFTLDTNELFYVGEGTKRRVNDKSNRNRWWNLKVKKHGFRSEIFFNELSKLEAQKKEKELIEKFRANLVNICPGSIFESHWILHIKKEDHPMFGKKLPKVSERIKKWNSEHSGDKSPTWKLKRPDLVLRNKMIQSKKNQRSVICLNNGKIFNSIKEAVKFYNLSGANIWKAINYGHKAAGFNWAYYDPTMTNGVTPFIQVK